MDRVPVFCLLFFMMSLLLTTEGCKRQYSLKSTWLDKKITIDGSDKDWKGKGRYFDEKSNTRIAIYNDNAYLYLCLESMDPGIQKSILRHGLSIWLCETGKSKTIWGLRYPFVEQGPEGDHEFGGFDKPGRPGEPRESEREQQNQPIHEAGNGRNRQEGPGAPADMKEPPGMPSFGGDERNDFGIPVDDVFLLLDAGKETESILTSGEMNDFDVSCKFSRKTSAGLVYEIKIPLNQSLKTPYAARFSPQQIVSIGFITEKVAGVGRPDGRNGPGRGPGGGGMGGGMGGSPPGGGMGGGMGGRPPGGGMGGGMGGRPDMGKGQPMGGGQRVESMEIWANIELSLSPDSIK